MAGTIQRLRKFDGAYVQSQLVLGAVDIGAGWGITRVHQIPEDTDPQYFDMQTMQPSRSFLKSQMGISGVVVYHLSNSLHLALDYFNSQVKWWEGEKQLVHSFNAGMTVTW